jgi:glucose 1-dehydrogenase
MQQGWGLALRALTIIPERANSAAITEVDDPVADSRCVLVEGLALGICATDRELAAGLFGRAAPGRERLVLGHESVGRVLQAPDDSCYKPGDLVTGYVRYPDPVPCAACAHGESDMCTNGQYTERGIVERDGFGSELWTAYPEDLVPLPAVMATTGVLVEPASVASKSWAHIDKIGNRAWFEPRRVLISGAGSVGLLCALFAVQRGLEVHLFDRLPKGPRRALAEGLNAQYHTSHISSVMRKVSPDVVIDTTGSGAVINAQVRELGRNGILCIIGFSWVPSALVVDANSLYREMVMRNNVVFGVVNAGRRQFEEAAEVLGRSDPRWLEAMVTRKIPFGRAAEGLQLHDEDVKVIIQLNE